MQVVELKIIAFFSANEFFQQFIINDIQAHLTGQGIKITQILNFLSISYGMVKQTL